ACDIPYPPTLQRVAHPAWIPRLQPLLFGDKRLVPQTPGWSGETCEQTPARLPGRRDVEYIDPATRQPLALKSSDDSSLCVQQQHSLENLPLGLTWSNHQAGRLLNLDPASQKPRIRPRAWIRACDLHLIMVKSPKPFMRPVPEAIREQIRAINSPPQLAFNGPLALQNADPSEVLCQHLHHETCFLFL